MKKEALVLDGCMGEGGGQVVRSGLSLAAALGLPLRIENIRGGRKRPGLLRQHRTAAHAIAEICGGELRGAELGSAALELDPGEIRAGGYSFRIGSAGSAMLVLQTVLPPLLTARGESRVSIEGGTHNPWAPPFEALKRAFAPVLAKAGAGLELTLERPGFYPAGGGRVTALIRPATAPRRVELLERGAEVSRSAEVLLAHLPLDVGERELEGLRREQPWVDADAPIRRFDESAGPGNVVHVTFAFENVTEVLTAFGEKRVRAEAVGERLGVRAERYLRGEAPVSRHLADQLMLPLALLSGGRYRTTTLSSHATTNAEVINRAEPGTVEFGDDGLVRIEPIIRR